MAPSPALNNGFGCRGFPRTDGEMKVEVAKGPSCLRFDSMQQNNRRLTAVNSLLAYRLDSCCASGHYFSDSRRRKCRECGPVSGGYCRLKRKQLQKKIIKILLKPCPSHIQLMRRFVLAVRRYWAGKQRDLGSNPLRFAFLFKSCGLWTLSCDFVPHN